MTELLPDLVCDNGRRRWSAVKALQAHLNEEGSNPEETTRIAEELIEMFMSSIIDFEREAALQVLGGLMMAEKPMGEILLRGLQDPAAGVRRAVVQAVSTLDDEALAEIIPEIILRQKLQRLQYNFSVSLTLTPTLTSNSNPRLKSERKEVQEAAGASLAKLKCRKHLDFVLPSLLEMIEQPQVETSYRSLKI